MKFNKKITGYTLVEILIVMAIVIIILAIVFSAFNNLLRNQALDKDFISVVSLLDQAKSLAINSKSASQYGIFFSTSTVVLFKGQNYLPDQAENQFYFLNNRVNISAINLEGDNSEQIVFSRITGYANTNGTIDISLKDDPENKKTIQIYRTGVIEYK